MVVFIVMVLVASFGLGLHMVSVVTGEELVKVNASTIHFVFKNLVNMVLKYIQ